MKGFLNPDEVLKQLKLQEDIVVADFGCGSGGWVLPLAKKCEDGKIYALDILEEPLSVIKSRAKLEQVSNIETIQCDIEDKNGSTLLESSCDLILMTNLLFECEDKKIVLQEGKRVLMSGGKILVVDWKKDNPLTPEIEKVDFEEIKKIAKKIGLKLIKEFDAGSYHYGLIFEKTK